MTRKGTGYRVTLTYWWTIRYRTRPEGPEQVMEVTAESRGQAIAEVIKRLGSRDFLISSVTEGRASKLP